ncbi:helix-turn-helix domain-containing protein [Paenibacillus sp. CC-CFT747]|nr:helix-turn-helix domain-containing protein [Paenibacillus sp. CC-CFT747]
MKAVMYAKSILLDNPEQPGAVILFIIKETKLLENISPMNQTTVAVIDKNNQLIASHGPKTNYSEFLSYDRLTGKNGLMYGELSGEEMAVSYTTSKSSGWKYVSIMPSELFDEKMKYVKKLIYVSLTLSILIGGLVTFLFVKRNYNPLHSLIRNLSTRSGISFEEGSNEYGYLQAALNNTFAEKERIGQRLEQHRNAIRSHFLQGLLKGRLDQNVPVYESLAAHNINLTSPDFAVLLFQVDHYGKFMETGFVEPQKVRLVHFIIMNVAEEVAGSRHYAMAAEIDDMLACIINLQEGYETDDLTRIGEQVKQFVQDHFHIRLTIAVSGIHQELEGITRAYQDALAGLEYRFVMGSGEIIRYDDLPREGSVRESTSYYYPLPVEQQLINFVKTGDYEKSKALIDEVVEINESDASLSVPMAKCLMFDLISTMLKTIDEIGASDKREFLNRVNAVDRLTACETIKEMKIQIGDVLRQVCQSIQEERKQDNNLLSQKVIAYVREHYSSDNLNIAMIGEAFRLTPSYLSKQFKAQTGEALLEFINKTRIEKAKKLLSEEAGSIMEVARRVGYSDINTFNRVFKKYEGITPGKYKDIL